MDDIQIKVALTRPEYVRGVRCYLRKTGIFCPFEWLIFAIIGMLTAGLLWLTGMTILNTALIVLLSMCVVMGGFIYFIQPGYTYDHSPQIGESTTYTFSQQHIAVQSTNIVGVVTWSFLRCFWVSGFYFLVQDKQHYTIIPTQALSARREAFEQLLKQMISRTDFPVRTH